MQDLDGLEQAQLEILTAVAVLRQHSSPPYIAQLAAQPTQRVTEVLRTLIDHGIITRGSCRIAEEPLRQAILGQAGTDRLDRMNRAAAGLLKVRGVPVSELVPFWLECTPSGDQALAEDLKLAAASAESSGEPERAVDLLSRALEEGPDDPLRSEILDRLTRLGQRLLLLEGPLHISEALNADLNGSQRARAHASLARFLMLKDPEAAVEEIEAARGLATSPETDLWLQTLELESLLFPTRLSDRWWARVNETPAARRSKAEHAHHGLGLAFAAAPVEEVTATIDHAVRDGSLLTEIGAGSSTWNLAIQALRFVDNHRFAESLLTAGMRSAEGEATSAARAFPSHAWAYWHLDFGSVPRAVAHAEAALRSISELGLPVSEISVKAPLIEALILSERFEEASAIADYPIGSSRDTFVEPFILTARAALRSATGRVDAAIEDLRRTIGISSERCWRGPRVTGARTRLAELMVQAGRSGEALEILEPELEAAASSGSPGTLGVVVRSQALAHDGSRRLELLEHSIELLSESPLKLDLARSLIQLGAAHQRNEDLEPARQTYRRALASAEPTGASLLLNQAAEGLRSAGGRLRRPSSQGPESLTEQERKTAKLAARGLTNREVAETLWLTTKTVEFHLTNAYRKLGVSSRSQLVERFEDNPQGEDQQPAP